MTKSSQSAPGSLGAVVLLGGLMVLGGGCKDKGAWLQGHWLLVEAGKPGACHEFQKDDLFVVYLGSDCKGSTDPGLSGKWQMKGEDKFAIRRGKEIKAKMVLITERAEDHVTVAGAMTGSFFKIGDKGSEALISELENKGVIKLRALPQKLGCDQLGRPLGEIRKLPKEPKPRMIRARDEGLEYHMAQQTGDPIVDKVVFAVNLDQVDWISFQLTAAAFASPGPAAHLTEEIGNPQDTASTGTGEKRQTISMWKAYCKKVGGVSGKDVDVTLFAMPGKQEGYFYVSENVISSTWSELMAVASDPTQQADEEDEQEQPKGQAPAPAPKAPAAPVTAPVTAGAKKPPPPKPPPKARPGELAVPGRDDEI